MLRTTLASTAPYSAFRRLEGVLTTSPFARDNGGVTEPPKLDRLAYFATLATESPDDARARYAYANELYKAERWEEAAEELEAYLALNPGDEGNAFGRLGECFAKLGRVDEAADAYLAGIDAAFANGHTGLADDFEQAMEAL